MKVKEIDPTLKNPEKIAATQDGNKIYILKDRSVDKAFGEIVHEGKHVLDEGISITKLREETKLIIYDKYDMKNAVNNMTDKQVIELRGRIAEREFQIAAKQKPDFSSPSEMVSFVMKEY